MITVPKRLTATPNCTEDGLRTKSPGVVTVWVEADRLWLRANHPTTNPDAVDPGGWIQMTQAEWVRTRDCVDRYFKALGA